MSVWLLPAAGAVTVLALLFAFRCWLELRKWARQCQRARIAVAYKQRVTLEAPLVDWLNWANMLGADQASRGRVVFRGGHVSVAILKPRPPAVTVERPSLRRRLTRRAPVRTVET